MTRRLAVGVALTLVVVGSLATLGWTVALPRYRPGLGVGERLGIDVSHHQDEIDWMAVAADDIEFAYLKATEGGDWVDPKFAVNLDAATEAGLEVGAYHFFRTCTDGATQAANLLATVSQSATTLPLAIDIEGSSNCAESTSEADIRAELIEMIELVEAERGPVIIYKLEGFDYLDDITAQRPRWQRSLLRRPSNEQWLVWQATNQANVNGITGRVDVNVLADRS